jgi:DNA-binding LacI/PurR family transcriptional regulator
VSRSDTRPARARIVDVAARAGVSPQTVSNVINGRGGFTEATRERVQRAVSDLGFQPNRYAQSLRSRRTMLIGFDLSGQQLDATNPFTVTFLRALVQAAAVRGYRVVAFTHDEDGGQGFRATVASGAVDGFVLSDAPPDDERSRVLADAGVPFVVFGRTSADLPQTWVDIDNTVAMQPLVDHLVAAGYRRFGWVGYPDDVYWNADRHEGARARLEHHGLALDETWTVVGTSDEVRSRVRALLAAADPADRPDVLLTSSDALAVVVANLAVAAGLRVGRDLAVTGFDAGPLSSMVEPPLTGVRMPVDRIAVALVDRLVAELSGRHGDAGEIVPTELVAGGSA